ncbi:DUF308 domain-containing protein [Veillonella agrestimuris]|uniref:DUF308 domain-containing protein n=1 Tax=Veillonella agrestimuris TaxID=2941340 RepID=UPI00203B6D7E|nr:DUF308 domain-containing protein [Veillonella agrestimuris]
MKKVLVILLALLNIIIGAYLLANPVENLLAFAWVMSIFLLFNAIANFVRYFALPKEFRSGWYLLSAFISALFAFFLVSGGFAILPLVIPITLGIWLIIDGILLFIKSGSMRTTSIVLLSILLFLFGLFLIINPLAFGIATMYVIGAGFILSGISSLYNAFKG